VKGCEQTVRSMKGTKIQLVTHQFLPEFVGGSEVYTLNLAKSLAREGLSVSILTYRESNDLINYEFGWGTYQFEGILVYTITYNLATSENVMLSEYWNPQIAWWADEIWNDVRPEIIHFTHLMKLTTAVLEAAINRGFRTVVSLTDYWSICPRHTLTTYDQKSCDGPEPPEKCIGCIRSTHGLFSERIFQWPRIFSKAYMGLVQLSPKELFSQKRARFSALYSRNKHNIQTIEQADRVLVLSHSQKIKLIQNGFSAEKLIIEPHGLNIDGLQVKTPRKEWPRNIRITFIGSIVPSKGLHMLLEAWISARTDGMELVVYGDMRPSSNYTNQISALAKNVPNVIFKGTFHTDNIHSVLAKTDVIAVPSLWAENEPFVAKIAIYTQTPVVATQMESLEQMITPGQTGWLLPPDDIRAWVDWLSHLKSQPYPVFKSGKYSVRTLQESMQSLIYQYQSLI